MAYNLRSRRIRDELLVEDDDAAKGGVESESERISDDDESSYTSEEEESESVDVGMEDAEDGCIDVFFRGTGSLSEECVCVLTL